MRTIEQMKAEGLITIDPITNTYEADVTNMTDDEIGLIFSDCYDEEED